MIVRNLHVCEPELRGTSHALPLDLIAQGHVVRRRYIADSEGPPNACGVRYCLSHPALIRMAYMERKTLPSANHIITEKAIADKYAAHQRALSAVRARIDNKPPKQYGFLSKRSKKAAMMEGETVAVFQSVMQ